MLLANSYRPDPRVRLEAKALIDSGIKVTVLAWSRDTGLPTSQSEEGIEIVRVGPRCAFRSPSEMISRLPRYWLAALRKSRELQFDVVHSHDLDTLPLGLLVSAISGKPLLYDSHELYSAMVKDDVGPMYVSVAVFERLIVRCPDAVITVNETLARKLSWGRRRKARVVMTSQDVSSVDSFDHETTRKKYGLEGFVISYLGSLEPGRFVEEMIRAFTPEDGVTVLVAGRGSLERTIKEAAESSPHVRFLGQVDAEEALRLTAASDMVSAMMDPSNPNNVVGTPGKVLNSMALGRPIITTEGLDIGELVRKVGCGLVVPYERSAFREAVRIAKIAPGNLEHMGSLGRQYHGSNMSWEKSREELLEAYNSLPGARR